jgi:hypothetical protein
MPRMKVAMPMSFRRRKHVQRVKLLIEVEMRMNLLQKKRVELVHVAI